MPLAGAHWVQRVDLLPSAAVLFVQSADSATTQAAKAGAMKGQGSGARCFRGLKGGEDSRQKNAVAQYHRGNTLHNGDTGLRPSSACSLEPSSAWLDTSHLTSYPSAFRLSSRLAAPLANCPVCNSKLVNKVACSSWLQLSFYRIDGQSPCRQICLTKKRSCQSFLSFLECS